MTAEQIIKGLEESVKKIEAHYDARNIPKDKRPSENKKALKLIKDLLAENRGLNSAIVTLQGIAKDYEHRNENLIRENKYLRERRDEETEHAKDLAITDTVKKMQEMMAKHKCTPYPSDMWVVPWFRIEEITKEILEGTQND